MSQDSFLHTLFTRYAVAFAIALLTILFLWQALELVKPSPKYDAFCTSKIQSKNLASQDACVQEGGKWEAVQGTPQGQTGYCNVTFTCQQNFDRAKKEYTSVAFIVMTLAGLVLVLIGMFLKGSQVVTNGLLFAGLLALFTGSVSNWSYMLAWSKALILAIALGIIIYFAWKKFQD
jgi:hypothetical protein